MGLELQRKLATEGLATSAQPAGGSSAARIGLREAGHGAEPCLLWTKGLRAPGSLRLILIAWHGGCCFFLCLSSRICSLRSLRDQVAIWMPSGHPDAQLKVYLRVCTNYSNNHQEELSRADCSSTSLMLRRSNTSCCGDSQPSNYFHLRLRNCDFAIVMNHHVNI